MNSKSCMIEVAIASVFFHLIKKNSFELSADGMLVLEALQRAKPSLKDKSITEVGDYLDGLTKEQVQGLASNVKGIYHELLYVQKENTDGDEMFAALYPDANYPGADIVLQRDGVVVDEIQLKATDNISEIEGHFVRYPDIPILVTSEISGNVADASSSGYSNESLTNDVSNSLGVIQDQSTMSHFEEVAIMTGIVSAAIHSGDVLKGNASVKTATVESLKDIGVVVSATALVDFLFF